MRSNKKIWFPHSWMHFSKKKHLNWEIIEHFWASCTYVHEFKHLLCDWLPKSQNFVWCWWRSLINCELILSCSKHGWCQNWICWLSWTFLNFSMNSSENSLPLCDATAKIVSIRETFIISTMIIQIHWRWLKIHVKICSMDLH